MLMQVNHEAVLVCMLVFGIVVYAIMSTCCLYVHVHVYNC